MLNKADIINKVAADANISKIAAAAAYTSIFETIIDELKKGERVAVHGFGTFNVKERAARKGRNPQTGSEMLIPARRVVGFKSATAVRSALNE